MNIFNRKTRPRVLAAMSGGVDSSVVAGILKETGAEVFGVHLQLWDHGDANAERQGGRCCSLIDSMDAEGVCDLLGIPYYVINAEKEFRTHVVDRFIDEYSLTRTPNPCAECNTHIKFGFLIEKAKELGCDYVATGHYARILHDVDAGGRARLLKALDPSKDQSYYLYGLTQEALRLSLFPLGGMSKFETREKAISLGLMNADKPDSQEICFIGKEGYAKFIEREAPGKIQSKGEIRTMEGEHVGTHEGLHHYTVGQRKGLALKAKNPGQYFVVGLKRAENLLIVGTEANLLRDLALVENVNWIQEDSQKEITCHIRIRSQHEAAEGTVTKLSDGKAEIRFGNPQRAITPGQVAVFYNGDEVLGGGVIRSASISTDSVSERVG